MPPRASSRSRDGEFPRTSISPMRVPRTIRAVSSGASLCSAITLDDDDLDTLRPIHHKNYERSLSPILSSPLQEFHTKRARRRESDLSSPLKEDRRHRKAGIFRNRDDDDLRSQSEHTPKFHRMGLDVSGHRDLPPRNPKILLRRRTEPLPVAAREACLKDLGCLEDGRKTMLVNRFSPLPRCEEDYFAPSSLIQINRAASDDSYASMPLRMPIRKASMEEIRKGFRQGDHRQRNRMGENYSSIFGG